MRILRVILIPLVPGLLVFSYLWAVDADVNLATIVPNFFAEQVAGALSEGNVGVRLCRRLFYPGYLLLFSLPVIVYSLDGKRHWLHVLSVFSVVHFVIGICIILQDD